MDLLASLAEKNPELVQQLLQQLAPQPDHTSATGTPTPRPSFPAFAFDDPAAATAARGSSGSTSMGQSAAQGSVPLTPHSNVCRPCPRASPAARCAPPLFFALRCLRPLCYLCAAYLCAAYLCAAYVPPFPL